MNKIRIKTGAASFYIVAFSTLILSIIVLSFASLIIAEVSRTSKNDLSQSAYDSALAGIEDAKIAFLNYRNCLNQGKTAGPINFASADLTCEEIIHYMEQTADEDRSKLCDVVGHVLSRIKKTDEGPVPIEEHTETSGDTKNNMQQYYTCIKMRTLLDDYRSSLTSANPLRVIQVRLKDTNVNDIKSLRLSWYSDIKGTIYKYTNVHKNTGKIVFPSIKAGPVATPPTISIQLFQTASSFSLSQLEKTINSTTDRGTIFLVPSNNPNATSYNSASNDNIINQDIFLKSNDKTVKNLPHSVYCPEHSGKDFACSVSIAIPPPVSGNRNANTFLFAVSLPYGQPDTDFSLELCKNNGVCSKTAYSDGGNSEGKTQFDGVQVSIDSTGRANDLYRRIEARIENFDAYFPYPDYAVQLSGTGGPTLQKDFYTTSEYNFPF